jgi:hypothetical protein
MIETADGESMLILKEAQRDPVLVKWLDSLNDDISRSPLAQAKRLTTLICRKLDRPGNFRGQSIDLLGRALHAFRSRAFVKTYDRPLGHYLAGDIINKRMAFPRHRAALLLAALEESGLTPIYRYGLINVTRGKTKMAQNVTHMWLTLQIGDQEVILDPTFDLVANVREETMIGDQNPDLKIAGIRYYPTRFLQNDVIVSIRYEEMGEKKPHRLSLFEVERIR